MSLRLRKVVVTLCNLMYVLVGLGNPGRTYTNTRHNIGFKAVDEVAKRVGCKVNKKGFLSLTGAGKVGRKEVLFIKPQTFMNRSGEAVALISNQLSRLRHPPSPRLRRARGYGGQAVIGDRLLVVHDDLDLPVGKLRLSFGAGAGGHKGVLSIIEGLGTKDFYRLRIGIGRPLEGREPEEYVLEPFDSGETVKEVIERAADAIQLFYAEGPEKVMEEYNR